MTIHPHAPHASATSSRPARVVIADDECMFRASLRQLLAVPPTVVTEVYGVAIGSGFEVVGEAATGQEAVDVVRRLDPDLVLLDISMPRMNGLEALRELRPSLAARSAATPGSGAPRAVVLSAAVEQPDLLTAIRLGARAVVQKDAPTEVLFDAMVRVLAGQSWIAPGLVSDLVEMVRELAEREQGTRGRPFGLTPREREVLALVVEGCANKEIAQRCAVSEETIKHHLTRMFDKVGATNRLELAMTARSNGLID